MSKNCKHFCSQKGDKINKQKSNINKKRIPQKNSKNSKKQKKAINLQKRKKNPKIQKSIKNLIFKYINAVCVRGCHKKESPGLEGLFNFHVQEAEML